MVDFPLSLPPHADLLSAVDVLEACCAAAGLRVTLRGTLIAYPGSIHWHLKQGTGRGTLELTLWPVERRAWFKVSPLRDAPWIAPAIAQITAALVKHWPG
ncbi:MAG TPA: hypothetical protein VM536_23080 [Chloroflexia bacterium]|nr:hypothetical protein [Chloroflexia bacterium]